jgi:hypothetical protein
MWHASTLTSYQLRGITGPDGSFDDRAPQMAATEPVDWPCRAREGRCNLDSCRPSDE